MSALRLSRHKFGAVPTVAHGIRFASKLEARRYQELLLLAKAGEVRELELQPVFPLKVPERGARSLDGCSVLGRYVADFRYRQGPTGLLVIEDVKGYDVPLQRWRRRHAELQYGITVTLYPPRVTKTRRKKDA